MLTRRDDRRDEEFTSFVSSSYRSLRRTAYLMVGDWHLAEDVVQTALIGMYAGWSRIERSYGPGPYARRAVVNAAISERRRPHRRESVVEALADRVDRGGPVDQGIDERLVAALRALPPRQRAVVVLRYVEDLDVVRTANLLGVSEGTVKSQASRGLATLRERLAGLVLSHVGSTPETKDGGS